MGPCVKFVSSNRGIISKKKGGTFFQKKKNIPRGGGGSEGGLAKDYTFSHFLFFQNPFLT